MYSALMGDPCPLNICSGDGDSGNGFAMTVVRRKHDDHETPDAGKPQPNKANVYRRVRPDRRVRGNYTLASSTHAQPLLEGQQWLGVSLVMRDGPAGSHCRLVLCLHHPTERLAFRQGEQSVRFTVDAQDNASYAFCSAIQTQPRYPYKKQELAHVNFNISAGA